MERLSDYDYELPERLVAQSPLDDRSASRLLHLDRETGQISHRQFKDVLDLLNPGDLIVMNDTRVTALRVFGHRATGGAVELLLMKDLGGGRFEAMAKPAKKLKNGDIVSFEGGLDGAIVGVGEEGLREVDFSAAPDWNERLQTIGSIPLPPYIHAKLERPERYQTVYAETGGSSAAPTAGLHFTPEILSALKSKGVETAKVTLDVGIDTFRPVMAENLGEHRMHGEICRVPQATSEAIRNAKRRVIAVGTTTVRALESLAKGHRDVESGETRSTLFIRPGFEFKVVDGMFTNFHLPRTTMLMMISALAGKDSVFLAYREAVERDYRFLSFGDSMLIL